jgi:predicted RND superfamily exporter protein
MAEKFMGPYQLLVHVKANEQGGLLDPEAVHAIGDFSRYLRKQGGARDSIAFDMMVIAARSMLMDGNPKWQTVPLSREQVKGMGELVVEQGGVESFIDETFTEATISPFFPEKNTEGIEETAAAMQAYIDRHPSDRLVFRLGGGLLGMSKAINDGTRTAYWKSLAAAFVLVFFCAVLATRSLFQGLLITLPVAAAQAVVWTIMVATGMKVDMPVALVSAVAVGFCSVFGYLEVRDLGMLRGEADGDPGEGHPGSGETSGFALLFGFLLFAALLPWFFIGLRFPSQMVLALAMTVLPAAVFAALFVAPLAGPRRIGSSPGASEERHR